MKSTKPDKIKKEETEEKFKKLKEASCEYPSCNEKNVIHVSLPVTRLMEDGQLKQDEGYSLSVPLCDFHMAIAMQGLLGLREEKPNSGQYQLFGAFEIIEITLMVVEAMVFSGKLQKGLKNMKTAEEKASEVLKKTTK